MENYIKLSQEHRKVILDPDKWEALGLDPNKGLLIMGPVGVGKTYLIREYLQDKNRGFWIEPYNVGKVVGSQGYDWYEQIKIDHLTFDDLGKEPESINYYGTTLLPGQHIIELRYDVFQRTDGRNRTCFTTNLNRDLLKEKYGERCYSRLIEMCNIVAITGEDLRLKRETQL
jgi:hypothetical protein